MNVTKRNFKAHISLAKKYFEFPTIQLKFHEKFHRQIVLGAVKNLNLRRDRKLNKSFFRSKTISQNCQERKVLNQIRRWDFSVRYKSISSQANVLTVRQY